MDIPGSRGEANFVWKCRLCQVRFFARLRLLFFFPSVVSLRHFDACNYTFAAVNPKMPISHRQLP